MASERLDFFVFSCYILFMETNSVALASQAFWVIHRISFIEKNKVFPFGDLKLYPSEIHLMLWIDDIQASNATEIASQLGVTKGAISQTISRLAKKGLIQKTKDPFNKNEITLTYPPLGQEALGQYRSLRALVQQRFAHYFSSLSESDRQAIAGFLSHLEATLGSQH
jgi:DNA-binding MarR family transcriptional regulator